MVERTKVPEESSTGWAPGVGRWKAFTLGISASVLIVVIGSSSKDGK